MTLLLDQSLTHKLPDTLVRPAGIEICEDCVDALPGDAESFGNFGHWFALIADGFNNREVAVGAVHWSTMPQPDGVVSRHACIVSVNDVATDVTTIIPQRCYRWVSTMSRLM